MNGRSLLIGLAMSAVVLPTNAVLAAQEGKGSESVILYAKEGRVVFPHGRHQKLFVDCRPCHVLFPKETRAISTLQAEGKLERKAVMKMCKKCHEARVAKGEIAGPTACKGCHIK